MSLNDRIRCKCGAEILVVPDAKAMSSAIRNHVEEKHRHTKPLKNPEDLKTRKLNLVNHKHCLDVELHLNALLFNSIAEQTWRT